MNPYFPCAPIAIDEAPSSVQTNSRYIAGGTNLLDLMTRNYVTHEQLNSTSPACRLHRYETSADGGLRIGALSSYNWLNCLGMKRIKQATNPSWPVQGHLAVASRNWRHMQPTVQPSATHVLLLLSMPGTPCQHKREAGAAARAS